MSPDERNDAGSNERTTSTRPRPRITLVVAAASNGVMGADNQLPWHLPADLKRFKALTWGRPMIMGRKTYDSIGRPLPGRLNIVVSRQPGLKIEGCVVVDSIASAFDAAGDVDEIAVIGGAEIFKRTLPLADVIHLTRIHAEIEGDTFFPELDPSQWQETAVSEHPVDERHAYRFSFVELTRKISS